MPVHMCRVGQSNCENPTSSNEASIPDATEMNLPKSEDIFHEVQGNDDKPHKSCLSGKGAVSTFIHSSTRNCRRLGCLWRMLYVQVTRNSGMVESFGASGCSNSQNQNLTCSEISKPDTIKKEQLVRSKEMELSIKKEQLVRSKEMELSEFSPQDELEGNLFIFSIGYCRMWLQKGGILTI